MSLLYRVDPPGLNVALAISAMASRFSLFTFFKSRILDLSYAGSAGDGLSGSASDDEAFAVSGYRSSILAGFGGTSSYFDDKDP